MQDNVPFTVMRKIFENGTETWSYIFQCVEVIQVNSPALSFACVKIFPEWLDFPVLEIKTKF